jgi:hypothetical protein
MRFQLNKTTSKTMMNRSGKLYIFEKDGKKIVYDVLSSFARCIGCDVSNLHKTLTNGKRVKEWRLVEVIDLLHPDWSHIDSVLEGVRITPRIEKKLSKIRDNLLDLKCYGIPKDDRYPVKKNDVGIIPQTSSKGIYQKPKDDRYPVKKNDVGIIPQTSSKGIYQKPKDDRYPVKKNDVGIIKKDIFIKPKDDLCPVRRNDDGIIPKSSSGDETDYSSFGTDNYILPY